MPGGDWQTPRPLSEAQIDYIEWLVNPESTGSKAQYARDHNVSYATVLDWPHQPKFRKALRTRMDELNVSPERTQDIIKNLHRLAQGKDATAVAAAKLYLQYIERLEPTRKPIEDRKIKDLSKDELRSQLRSALEEVEQK